MGPKLPVGDLVKHYRWQFLKRNNDYQNDYSELTDFIAKHLQESDLDYIEDGDGVIDSQVFRHYKSHDSGSWISSAVDQFCSRPLGVAANL